MTHTPEALTGFDARFDEAEDLLRAGRPDEARDLLVSLREEGPPDDTRRLRLAVRLSVAERALGLVEESRRTLLDVASLAEACEDPALRGRFHNGLAVACQRAGEAGAAFENFTAASVFYERAGEARLRADVENNLAVLQIEAGRHEAALDHIALSLGSCPGPAVRAQIEDTRARAALLRGDTEAALYGLARSLLLVEESGEGGLLGATVETLGRAVRRWEHEREAARLRAALGRAGWRLRPAAAALGYRSRQALKNHLVRHFPEVDLERRARVSGVR